jgi:biotin carboxyl carrier protein
MPAITVNAGDADIELDVSRVGDDLHVVRNGQRVVLRLVDRGDGDLLLEWLDDGGTRRRIRVAGQVMGNRRQMWVNGRHFSYERVRERGGTSSAVDSSLAAAIPAIVSQVLVAAGDLVSEGDKLLLLESMKMVIPIQAPYGGRVTAVLCAPGDSVQAGVALVTIDRAEE